MMTGSIRAAALSCAHASSDIRAIRLIARRLRCAMVGCALMASCKQGRRSVRPDPRLHHLDQITPRPPCSQPRRVQLRLPPPPRFSAPPPTSPSLGPFGNSRNARFSRGQEIHLPFARRERSERVSSAIFTLRLPYFGSHSTTDSPPSSSLPLLPFLLLPLPSPLGGQGRVGRGGSARLGRRDHVPSSSCPAQPVRARAAALGDFEAEEGRR